MRIAFTTSLILFASSVATAAIAAPVTWTVQGPATRAQISGGPWVLAEGDAASPAGQYPTPNPGTSAFQPYYQSYVVGTDTAMQGFFDYRPYKLEEAVVAAKSSDQGKTWTFQSQVLDFAPSRDDAGPATDVANGHPFVATVAGKTYLYNLDRTAGYVGVAGLLVHEIKSPTAADPLGGVPAKAELGDAGALRTIGLAAPDGILAALPGANGVTTFMYLEKQLVQYFDAGTDAGVTYCGDGGPATPIDRTQLHLADTTDGITFTNDRLVTGIIESGNGASVGPRGTIHKYADGHYGMFFSAGTLDPCEDSDAFHYIGYAESNDLTTWTVVNGLANPLLSTDKTKDPNQLSWYAGRAYAPNVLFGVNDCEATLEFSGYSAYSPKVAPKNDYRQIGVVTITRPCEVADAGDGGSTTTPDAGSVADSGNGPSNVDSGSGVDAGQGVGVTSAGDDGGCSYAPGAATGGAAWVAMGAFGAMIARRRRRSR